MATIGTGKEGSKSSACQFGADVDPVVSALHDIRTTLQNSTIVGRGDLDVRQKFWNVYREQADEYDKENLEKYNGNLDSFMIFAGLFCVVCATFIAMLQPTIQPGIDLTARDILQIITSLDGFNIPQVLRNSIALLPPSRPPGPSKTVIWAQSLLYISVSSSLFAALAAVLGKRWLLDYSREKAQGSTLEDRCKERQRKVDEQKTWRFHLVLSSLGPLIQISLFCFLTALSASVLEQHKTIGAILTTVNAIAAFLYIVFSILASIFPDCPYKTPVSDGVWWSRETLLKVWEVAKKVIRQIIVAIPVIIEIIKQLKEMWDAAKGKAVAVDDPETNGLPEADDGKPTTSVGRCGSPAGQSGVKCVSETSEKVFRSLPTSGDALFASSISWIIGNSKDPSTVSVALECAIDIDWPRNYDVCPLLNQVLSDFLECFKPATAIGNQASRIISSRNERALACAKFFLLLYWHGRCYSPDRIIQWEPYDRRAGFADEKGVGSAEKIARRIIASRFESYSELQYVCGIIVETLMVHPDEGLNDKEFMTLQPMPEEISPSTASTLARVLFYMTRDARMQEPRLLDVRPLDLVMANILRLGIYLPLSPPVLERYLPAFTIALAYLRVTTSKYSFWETHHDVMLLRMREVQTTMAELPAPRDFFVTSIGRYASGFFELLSYCACTSQKFRDLLRGNHVAQQCLVACESIYEASLRASEADSILSDMWVSILLRLALSIMREHGAGENGHWTAPLTGLLLGKDTLLSLKDKKMMVPYLSYVVKCSQGLQKAYDTDKVYTPVFPEGTLSAKLDAFVSCLLALSEMLPAEEVPTPEVHRDLVESLACCRAALLTSDNYRGFHAVLWCTRSLLQSAIRMIGQTRQEWTHLPCVFAALFPSAIVPRGDNNVDQAYTDVIRLLVQVRSTSPGLSQRDMACLRSCWVVLQELHGVTSPGDTCPVATGGNFTSLARIFMNTDAIISQLQTGIPFVRAEWVSSLVMVCAAWSDVGDTSEVVKISVAAAQQTLDVLENVPEDVLKENECCLRKAGAKKRSEEELEIGDDLSRQLFDRVHAAFTRKVEDLDRWKASATRLLIHDSNNG